MILEEATFEAFGYYPRDLKPQSNKPILAACELCGRFKMSSKHDYHTFCRSCVRKGKHCSEKTKAQMSEARKGEKHPMYNKQHTEEAKALMSVAKKGKSRLDLKGPNNSRWEGGKRVYWAKTNAKRKRDLGYTLLAPLAEGEDGHHVTNEFVIGIPADVHNSIGGGRKKHRTRVLQWLKANDRKKYKMVLCVLAQQPLNAL